MAAEWHLCRTESGAEDRVLIGVQAARMEAFLPVELVPCVHRGRRWTMWRPVFPGHVFAMLDPTRDIPRLKSIEGVDDLVRPNGKLVPVADDAIKALRRAERDGLFDAAANCRLPDDDAEPLDERFTGFVTKVRRARWSKKRTALLMDLLLAR